MLVALTALALGCIWTSTTLHNKMLVAVMKAPMRFFDSTPTGRILNRSVAKTGFLLVRSEGCMASHEKDASMIKHRSSDSVETLTNLT